MTKQQEKQAILRRARETLCGKLDAGEWRGPSGERDPLDAWRAGMKKAREEPPAAASAPEPPAIDWQMMQAWLDSHVGAAIEKERQWLLDELLPQIVAAVQDEASVELSLDVRRLNAELAELRALIGEAQAMLRADRGIASPVIDLQKPATPPN
jgi:hypothetical protein